MIKLLFICLGNICRSPMAEGMMKDLVSKNGLQDKYYIESAGTSSEEAGSPVHSGTRGILNKLGIDLPNKTARQIKMSDLENFDYIIAMEDRNVRSATRFFGQKPVHLFRLLDISPNPRDIADPWYTGNFEATYEDLKEGLEILLDKLENEQL